MNKIITIGREFGSGGREIGKRLAEILQIPYYDNEIVNGARKQITICVSIQRYIPSSILPIPLLSNMKGRGVLIKFISKCCYL